MNIFFIVSLSVKSNSLSLQGDIVKRNALNYVELRCYLHPRISTPIPGNNAVIQLTEIIMVRLVVFVSGLLYVSSVSLV